MSTLLTREIKTISDLLPGALVPSNSQWRVRSSGVNLWPSACPGTERIIEFLKSKEFAVETTNYSGPGSDIDDYHLTVPFLDGGLVAHTGNYIGGEKGAWITGPLSALYVALGLGLAVPKKFYENHGLVGTTFDHLETRVRYEVPYRTTKFVAEGPKGRIVIEIGRYTSGLDRVLEEAGASEWAYITAWNPRQITLSREENDGAQERLRQALRERGFRFFEGMSEPTAAEFAEASLLALLPRDEASALGLAFEQNAIVVGTRHEPAELLWLRLPAPAPESKAI